MVEERIRLMRVEISRWRSFAKSFDGDALPFVGC